MKLNQIGITIITVGAIIVSGCAADGSYTSSTDKNNTVDSPLIEFGDSSSAAVRPINVDYAAAVDGLLTNKTTANKSRWSTSCAADCRLEASEARTRCYKDNAPNCEREAQDVFDTCVQYECEDGGTDSNNAFGEHKPLVEETQAAEEALVDPILACQEACGKFGTKTYLHCLDETNGETPIRCRNLADEATHMCVITHCPSEEN